MASASDELKQHVNATTFETPHIPVYGNVNAAPLATIDAIRDELHRQLTQNVRWTESIQAMTAAGITHFVEIGSKDVLTGLLKRIDRSAVGISINNLESLRIALVENR
jgi:[acyl-carrier-protein] S-malonyltransferase